MFRLTFRLLFVFALTLCCARAAHAQRERDSWTGATNSVEIAGQVRFADGEPAPNVSLRVERFGGGGVVEQMLTDARGRFRFSNLPRGQYVVQVSVSCFAAAQQQVDLQLIFKSYMDFELRPEKSSPACRAGEGEVGVVDARVPAGARREFEKGREALADKRTAEGLQHLQKAIRLYPEFFEAQLLAGTSYMEAGEWQKAEEALKRAAAINTASAIALVSLGEAERRQKRYAEAEKTLLAALKRDDKSWQGHFTLGRVYWEMNDVVRAAPSVGRTLQLKPDFAEAHLLGGNVLLRLNQPERALLEYEEYLRLTPEGEFAAPTRELVSKLRRTIEEKKR